MKKYFLVLPMILVVCGLFAQTAPKVNGPVITWEKATYDFGDMVQGDKVEHTYTFANTGNEPLIITNVSVTCGCTTPKGWPKDPIAPGGKGEITVGFNSAGKSGKVNKVVTIVSNSVGDVNQVSFTTNILQKAEPQ
jgi:hypothetical protein